MRVRRSILWCKEALIKAPVLSLPQLGENAPPFKVITDASGFGLGAVLMQDGHPIAYESRTITPAERNYTTGEQELLAVVHALRTWRPYLEGVKFTVVTDHQPNTHFPTQSMLSRRQARWQELLSRYVFDWVYKPGRTNVADPLSRSPKLLLLGTVLTRTADGYMREDDMDPEDSVLVQDLQAAYAHDQWFADEGNISGLQLKGRSLLQRRKGLRGG